MTVTVERGKAAPRPQDRRRATRLAVRLAYVQQRAPLAQLVVLMGVCVWGAVNIEGFATGPAVRANLILASLLALASLGQTLIVLLGGLDFAVPAYITVGAVAAVQLGGHSGWPLWTVALSVALFCGLMGAFCGFICHRLKVQSLVVTLGVYSILISGAVIVTSSSLGGAPPKKLTEWTSVASTTFGLPVPPVVVVCVAVTAAVSVILARTPVGRRLYATGANEIAARGMFIRTGWMWTGIFAANAAVTGLVGLLVAGFASGATAQIGDPYLYSGLAAVLVGGTALRSARGDFLRTAIGACLLTVLITIFSGLGFGEGDTRIVFGIAIVLVVSVYGRQRRLNDRV